MNNSRRKQLISLATLVTLLIGNAAQAKIVCWTNSEGIRECGNSVPPEYAQKETRTINKRGITTDVQERAKTPEEIAEEKAREAEEKRIAEEKARQEREQAAYDRVLLSTYISEDDIIRARDRQSSSIDATIEITRITIDRVQEKLDSEKKKAANFERQGKKLPKTLKEDIASMQQQIQDKQRFIDTKEAEKQKIREKFDADMLRFRELKASGAHLR